MRVGGWTTWALSLVLLESCSTGGSSQPGEGVVSSSSGGQTPSPAGAGGGAFSTGGSAGSGAAAAGGAGGVAGAGGSTSIEAGCATSPFVFCEDFESYDVGEVPGGAWFEPSGQYGQPVIETTEVRTFSGSRSVDFRVDKAGGRAFLSTHAPFPLQNNVLYGRMMVYFEALPTSAHWDVVSAFGEDGVCAGNYRWGGQNGHTLANYHPGDCYRHFNAVVPEEGAWLCYEWKFDGNAEEMHLWIDDYDRTDRNHAVLSDGGQGCANAGNCPPNPHPGQAWVAPEWMELSLGWAHYQAEEIAPRVWIDDVVIHDERVGCPAAL